MADEQHFAVGHDFFQRFEFSLFLLAMHRVSPLVKTNKKSDLKRPPIQNKADRSVGSAFKRRPICTGFPLFSKKSTCSLGQE
jgi:hypothetical protein